MGSGAEREAAREFPRLVPQTFERAPAIVGEERRQMLPGQLAKLHQRRKRVLERSGKGAILGGGLPQHFCGRGNLGDGLHPGPVVGDDLHQGEANGVGLGGAVGDEEETFLQAGLEVLLADEAEQGMQARES